MSHRPVKNSVSSKGSLGAPAEPGMICWKTC